MPSQSKGVESNSIWEGIKIEVRINELYVLKNYVQGIQHLLGVIEIDALDSFKMSLLLLDVTIIIQEKMIHTRSNQDMWLLK